MSRTVILLVAFAAAAISKDDPSSRQILEFRGRHERPVGVLTTGYGMPVEYKKVSSMSTTNLLENDYFMESITHFSREKIPERVVHALGSGAQGYFEVTDDITHICKAKLFSEIGKITPVTVRFSLVSPNKGAADTTRNIRGFAVKFYTEEGNLDIVGLNVPVFSIKDPLFFTTFVRVQSRNPATHMPDFNMLWDFITLRPESLHLFMYFFSDFGLPDGYRYMPGFGVHAFEVVNALGEKYYVKFHFLADAGIKSLTTEEAQKIAGIDPDYANRDLYNAIASGNFPSWTVAVQIVSMEELKHAKIDLFDITRLWPISEYPLHKVGKLVLNKNPTNYFAEVEQLALNPVHLVPGINGALDAIFRARRLSYRDTQYYRLGANFENIPINCPFQSQPHTYNRDGRPPLKQNANDHPNYYPNSFNGAMPYLDDTETEPGQIYQDFTPNNFDQVRDMYINMSEDEQCRLVETIVGSLRNAADFLQERAVKMFSLIHTGLSSRVLHRLHANTTIY